MNLESLKVLIKIIKKYGVLDNLDFNLYQKYKANWIKDWNNESKFSLNLEIFLKDNW